MPIETSTTIEVVRKDEYVLALVEANLTFTYNDEAEFRGLIAVALESKGSVDKDDVIDLSPEEMERAEDALEKVCRADLKASRCDDYWA